MRPNHTAQGRHQALFRRTPLAGHKTTLRSGLPTGTAWLLKGKRRFWFSRVLAAHLQEHPSCAARWGSLLLCLWLEAATYTGPWAVFLQHLWPPGGSLAQTPPARTVTGRFSCTWASQKHRNAPHTTGALLSMGSSPPWDAPQPRTTERLSLLWRGALLKNCIHFSITNYTFLDLRLWVLVIFNTVKKITLDFRVSLTATIHCSEIHDTLHWGGRGKVLFIGLP